MSKHNKYEKLKVFIMTSNHNDLMRYKESKKQFKLLGKKNGYKAECRDLILKLCNNSQMFWKCVKSLDTRRPQETPTSPDRWFDHFKALLR